MAISSTHIFPLTLVVCLTILQYVIRSWRWAVLLGPIKNTGFFSRLSANTIGFAANFVLPARLGELVRANSLGRSEGIRSSSVLGTLVVERLFDGFTLLLALLIGLSITTFPEKWQSVQGSLRATGFFLFGMYIFLIVFLLGFKYKTQPFLNLLDRLIFFLPAPLRKKILVITWDFSLGLVLTNDIFKIGQAVFYSLFLWASILCQIHFVENSVGLNIPFASTFIILSMASFGVMIPSAPGFIGTFHLSVQYGLMFYGVGKEEALSAAIVWHAALFFPTVLVGFIFFLYEQTMPRRESEIVVESKNSSLK